MFKPSTKTIGVGVFRESHGAMPPAGPVVVVDYRTHLHANQSNAPKLKLHPPFIHFSQASAFRHTKAFRKAYKNILVLYIRDCTTVGTVRSFSIKSVLK